MHARLAGHDDVSRCPGSAHRCHRTRLRKGFCPTKSSQTHSLPRLSLVSLSSLSLSPSLSRARPLSRALSLAPSLSRPLSRALLLASLSRALSCSLLSRAPSLSLSLSPARLRTHALTAHLNSFLFCTSPHFQCTVCCRQDAALCARLVSRRTRGSGCRCHGGLRASRGKGISARAHICIRGHHGDFFAAPPGELPSCSSSHSSSALSSTLSSALFPVLSSALSSALSSSFALV